MLTKINNDCLIEKVKIEEIAKKYGTPTYIYSTKAIKNSILKYFNAFKKHKSYICYSVKANSNLSILKLIHNMGCGFDIVSGGELQRVLLATKKDASKVIYSGINKTEEEIKLALENNILCFNIESLFEIDLINNIAKKLKKIAPISIRINPNINAKTHPFISTGLKENKFGIPFDQAIKAYKYANELSNLEIIGIDFHIGSQLIDISPIIEATNKLIPLIEKLLSLGIKLKHIDIGGGVGISYNNEKEPNLNDFANNIFNILSKYNLEIILEPGRSIIGNTGILITKVSNIKLSDYKNFIIVDAAMNDLIRPSMYNAYHEIINTKENNNIKEITADIVGPICESGDFLAKNRKLKVQINDILIIKSTGAYASSMGSNYNTRCKPDEILVDGDNHRIIRSRETVSQILANEVPYL